MVIGFIESIGDKTANIFISTYNIILFSTLSILNIFNPVNYTKTLKTTFVLQLYRTTIAIIPRFSIFSFFFGSVLVSVLIILASKYNLHLEIGSFVINFIINTFATVFSALFVLIKSNILYKKPSVYSNTTPYLLSSVLSTMTLSLYFTFLVLISSFIPLMFFIHIDLHSYKQLIFDSIELLDILTLFTKSILYGLIITIVPIYHKAKSSTLLHIILTTIISIFTIEVLSLILRLYIN